MANNLYTASGNPVAGAFGRSSSIRAEFALIEAAMEKTKRHYVVLEFPDLNTADIKYSPALELGTISRVYVIPDENNATTATVITLAIAGVAVTMSTLQLALGALAGAVVSVAPTAANVITSRTAILRATTDGGGSSAMPGRVIVEIERS